MRHIDQKARVDLERNPLAVLGDGRRIAADTRSTKSRACPTAGMPSALATMAT
jgi:hypothetical protein